MTHSGDIGALSVWLKLVLLFAGTSLMLTAAGLIPVDASRFHTPHWVVFVAGLAFLAVGIIAFLAKHRDTHPARYLFAVGVLMTSLFLVAAAVSIYASGSVIAIGPISIKGAAADDIARSGYGVSAVIMGMLAFAAWRRWLQAVKSPDPSLQSGQNRPSAEREP
jgi:hypothetical protein